MSLARVRPPQSSAHRCLFQVRFKPTCASSLSRARNFRVVLASGIGGEATDRLDRDTRRAASTPSPEGTSMKFVRTTISFLLAAATAASAHAEPAKTREQVRAERLEAIRTGDVYANGDIGLKRPSVTHNRPRPRRSRATRSGPSSARPSATARSSPPVKAVRSCAKSSRSVIRPSPWPPARAARKCGPKRSRRSAPVTLWLRVKVAHG